MSKQLDLFGKKSRTKADYIAKSYKGIYGMHKYWSKKPYNIIREFILKYTNEKEIVLDPFCGSGISVAESLFTNRKVIGVDINPSAIFITKNLIKKIPVSLFEQEFKKLELSIKKKINSLYIVKRDNKEYVGTHFIWENERLKEVWYKNSNNKKIIDAPTYEDIELFSSFSYEDIPYYYPKSRFFHNTRINAHRDKRIFELFTPRNLKALSFLMNKIEKIRNEEIKELMRFCFTASTGQASKMVFVVKRRGKYSGNSVNAEKKEVGSWIIGYWLPKEYFEINVWNCFENRYKRILKAKKQQKKINYKINLTNSLDELLVKDKNMILFNKPAQNILKKIPNDSIDYVITDPPHGNRQPYLELSMMWNEWLRETVNYQEEIVISESKDRNKDIENYNKLLNDVFKEIYRILKKDHYFSLMFNSLDNGTWINLITNLNKLKFELKKIETMSYSAHSVVQDTRNYGLKTDFILTFKKNPKIIVEEIKLISFKENKEDIIKIIEGYVFKKLIKRDFEPYQIINLVISKLLKKKIFIKISDMPKILKIIYNHES